MAEVKGETMTSKIILSAEQHLRSGSGAERTL